MATILSDPLTRSAGAGPFLGSEPADWLALLKPRVMSLVVFTGFCGMVAAPGRLHPVLAVTALLCIAVAAGAAGAINMWYDRDIDAVMRRTADRPVPAGRVMPRAALGYGITLACGAALVMDTATNTAAAALLAASVLFYVFVYTMWLKRRTPQNIVVGGAAGAFPPVIGWVAVTGHLAPLPVLLFLIVFLWTPPHFWALSLYACGDYERAGVPMLPVVAGRRETRRQIVSYTLVLLPVSLLPTLLGLTGVLYGGAALVLGLAFLAHAVRVWRDQDGAGDSLRGDAPARAMFRFSLLHLALLFAAVAADRSLAA